MPTEHYDERYFKWQKNLGEFGGWANITKFQKYIKPHFNVVDFGCGGGYLLKSLDCKGKIGIDVSQKAREQANALGINTFATSNQVEDGWADVIISDNALEHCFHPLEELKTLYPKLKHGGRIILVVPCESVRYRYIANDINHHLYSWSPMSLGNLFTEAGFVIEESKSYLHKWPKKYRFIARVGGRRLFDICCRIYARIERSWFQVRIVARKD